MESLALLDTYYLKRREEAAFEAALHGAKLKD